MYSEYAIFQKDDNYLIFFPQIYFWFKTNKYGLRVFKNLLDGKNGEKELQMKSVIERGMKCIETIDDYNIELAEIEYNKDISYDSLFSFFRDNYNIMSEKIIKGIIIKQTVLLTSLSDSQLFKLGIDYLEIDCKGEKLAKEIYNFCVFNFVKTIHLNNAILDEDEIYNIKKIREKFKIEFVIHLDSRNNCLYNYISICAHNDLYFTVNFESMDISYYEFYKRLSNYVQALEWKIDYKKFCSIYNYSKVVSNRIVRKSCGIARDKIYICENGNIYSCQDCAQRNCFRLGSIYDTDFSSQWRNGDVCKHRRLLTVETMKECGQCYFRYMCGGQCRMKSLDKFKVFDAKSAFCADEKKIYVELLWENIINE